jgi:protein-disulfide isomerase
MISNAVPRLAAPVVLGAAILLSFSTRKPTPPVELPGGEAPAPPPSVVEAAFARAVAPGGPGYDRGTTRAAVTVLEFSDFGCPYCGRFAREIYPAVADEFVKTGLVRWKYVPFVLGIFGNDAAAARAGACAGEQGRAAFDRMHDALYAQQAAWTRSSDPARAFQAMALGAGLDAARFASCYGSAATDAKIQAASALADEMGVRATPTFFVNGRMVEGALPVEEFRAVLMQALRQTREHGTER